MNNQTEEIKQKLDIVEYIGQRVTLKKSGRNFKGCCPFHNEKTPSFVVSAERQIWHCFGTCGTGGDIITFLMRWDNLSFVEALQELAQLAGVSLEKDNFDDTQWKHKEQLFQINQLAMKFYQYLLHTSRYGTTAMKYLISRGLNEKIINTFEIGYAPSSWDSLHRFLLKKGCNVNDIVSTGLEVTQDGNRGYDRFRNRIVFPLKDIRGNIVGFSGRLLDENEKIAKYINTPETEIYHKRDHLYGINLTKEAIRKSDLAIIVEGEFDLISPFQHGIENIVAIKGSALTEGQLNILKRFTKRIALALDTDAAGVEAMKRGIEVAEKMDFEIHIVEFSNGKDPDEAVLKDKVVFLKDVKKARPIYDFLIDSAQKKYPDKTAFHKKKIADEVAPFIRLIQNPIVKSHYVRYLSGLLEVEESSVEKLLRNVEYAQKTHYKQKQPLQNSIPREELLQKYILSYLLQYPEPAKLFISIEEFLDGDVFSIPAYKSLFLQLYEYSKQITSPYDYNLFAKTLNPQNQSVTDELYMFVSEIPDLQELNVIKLLFELKIMKLKSEIQSLLEQDKVSDDEKLTALTAQLKRVEKKYRT